MIWRVSYAIKTTIAHAFHWLGVFYVWQRVALRNKAVVLMYHRVLSDTERRRTGSHPGYVVGDGTFARHIDCVSRRFQVLSEEQFARHLCERRPFPDSSCLITFDDGWIDNLTNALPVLQRHRLPAVIYLPVNFIGGRRLFAREALTHLIAKAIDHGRIGGDKLTQVRQTLEQHGLAHVLDTPAKDSLSAAVDAVARFHRRAEDSAMLVDALEDVLQIDVEDLDTFDGFMNWDQVREMAGSGITFGGHGLNHLLLAELPPADAQQEIQGAMAAIAAELAPASSFSYPNGSLTPEVREMVKAAGYQFALTTESGRVEAHDDRFTIKRVNIHEDMTNSTPMFLARVLGLF